MPRFFVSQDTFPNITGSDVHHIKNVLRLKPGETIELCDGLGKVYEAKILDMDNNQVNCRIISETQTNAEPAVKVTLAQCLPKGKKMDLIVQKATELGATKIIPVLAERSVSKAYKISRWQKIAREAAEQSGRAIIPEVQETTSLKQLLAQAKNFDLALIPWELEKDNNLKKVLLNKTPKSILVVIGPEGGFSQSEINQAKEVGFKPISLGPRILRTETAGLATLASINYHFDQ